MPRTRAWPKEFGGDTVGRLGMCAHTPKRNMNNAHGVTPIQIEEKQKGQTRGSAPGNVRVGWFNWRPLLTLACPSRDE
jgi:hypothetical protein